MESPTQFFGGILFVLLSLPTLISYLKSGELDIIITVVLSVFVLIAIGLTVKGFLGMRNKKKRK